MAKINNDEVSTRFYELVRRWIEVQIKEASFEVDAYQKILELTDFSQITPANMIRTISELFVPDLPFEVKHRFVYFLMRLADKGHSHPEFFWIIQKSNILFEHAELTWAGIVSAFLRDLVGTKIWRSYLCYSLLTEDKTKYESILSYFVTVQRG